MRNRFGLVAALALAAATVGGGTAEARRGWHHSHGWHGGGLVIGLLGGALLGAAISRPYYGYGPVYSYGYGPAYSYGYGPGYGYGRGYRSYYGYRSHGYHRPYYRHYGYGGRTYYGRHHRGHRRH
jgi:hypothetical protein